MTALIRTKGQKALKWIGANKIDNITTKMSVLYILSRNTDLIICLHKILSQHVVLKPQYTKFHAFCMK